MKYVYWRELEPRGRLRRGLVWSWGSRLRVCWEEACHLLELGVCYNTRGATRGRVRVGAGGGIALTGVARAYIRLGRAIGVIYVE